MFTKINIFVIEHIITLIRMHFAWWSFLIADDYPTLGGDLMIGCLRLMFRNPLTYSFIGYIYTGTGFWYHKYQLKKRKI